MKKIRRRRNSLLYKPGGEENTGHLPRAQEALSARMVTTLGKRQQGQGRKVGTGRAQRAGRETGGSCEGSWGWES